MSDYLKAEKQWQENINRKKEPYKKVIDEAKNEQSQIISNMNSYIFMSSGNLYKQFRDFCTINNLTGYDAVMFYVTEGIAQNWFHGEDYIQLRSLINKYDQLGNSIYDLNYKIRLLDNNKFTFDSYKRNKVPKLPTLIRENTPEGMGYIIGSSILILYFCFKILILFIRLGKWINKTSKLNIE